MPNRRGRQTDGGNAGAGKGGGDELRVSQKTCHSEVFTKRKERQPVGEYSYTTAAGSLLFYNLPSR